MPGTQIDLIGAANIVTGLKPASAHNELGRLLARPTGVSGHAT